jgi:hypothetical protein
MARNRRRLAICCLLLAGCSNAPDALNLRLIPHQAAFQQGEAPHLDLDLSAARDPVCLSGLRFFEVELRQIDGHVTLKSEPPALCGTPLVASIPLLPVLYPAALLDLADVSGRFVILRQGQNHHENLLLYYSGERLHAYAVDDPESWAPSRTPTPLPAGRYQVRVRLINRHGGLPCPLFWKPYDQPVAAEAALTITGTAASSAGKD